MTFVGGTTCSLSEPAYKKPFDFLAENNQMAKPKKSRFANEKRPF